MCCLQVVWGDVSPKWAETHYLYVQERAKALLKLRVIDKNKLMSDVDLGVVMTGLQPLLDKPGRKVELPLKGMCMCVRVYVCMCACVGVTSGVNACCSVSEQKTAPCHLQGSSCTLRMSLTLMCAVARPPPPL